MKKTKIKKKKKKKEKNQNQNQNQRTTTNSLQVMFENFVLLCLLAYLSSMLLELMWLKKEQNLKHNEMCVK
jgi:hypothetical protein